MGRSIQFSISIAVFLVLLFLASSAHHSLAYSPPTSGFGNGEINGPVSLRLTTDPAIVQPGEEFDLQLSLANSTRSTYSPAIKFELPATVKLVSNSLPSGMTVNFQSGHLDWLPVVSGNNGRVDYVIRLKAITANILLPEQAIRATMVIDDQTLTVESRLWIGTPPQINGIVLPSQVAVGQPVQLRGDITGSGPFTQRWELSDGRIIDVNDPELVFSEAGEIEVTLTAVNPLTSSSKSRTLRVVPQPAAQFVLSDFTVGQYETVEFINQSGGVGPLQTVWEFGDGTSSTEARPSHAYAEPGIYQVHLTVVNQYGRSEAYGSVTVGAAPNVELELPESVAAGDAVQANALGDDSITRYQWDFGNGRLFDGPQIASRFNATGDYYVTLTAYNEFGQTTTGQWINVRPGTIRSYLPLILRPGQTDDITVVSVARPIRQGGAGEGLPDVPLNEPFVMTPLNLPVSMTMTEQLLVYVNEARRQFGLRPLTEVPTLTAAAQQHAVDMAQFKYTGHIGADGSAPIERFVQFQYSGGYAGEATAWGFEHPYQAVEFWVNSPSHRKIILNEFATDLGVGYTIDLRAPSVWYWTTEYGNRFEAPFAPAIRVQQPLADREILNSEFINYGWIWPVPLADNQSFVVYADFGGEELLLGTVDFPSRGIYYSLNSNWAAFTHETGAISWRVALEAGGQTIAESERMNLTVSHDPLLPTVTPTAVPTEQPTLAPPTATATPFIPTPTSPPNVAPPPLATATPEP